MTVEQFLTECLEVLPQLFTPFRKGLFCSTLRNHFLMEIRVHQFLVLQQHLIDVADTTAHSIGVAHRHLSVGEFIEAGSHGGQVNVER